MRIIQALFIFPILLGLTSPISAMEAAKKALHNKYVAVPVAVGAVVAGGWLVKRCVCGSGTKVKSRTYQFGNFTDGFNAEVRELAAGEVSARVGRLIQEQWQLRQPPKDGLEALVTGVVTANKNANTAGGKTAALSRKIEAQEKELATLRQELVKLRKETGAIAGAMTQQLQELRALVQQLQPRK